MLLLERSLHKQPFAAYKLHLLGVLCLRQLKRQGIVSMAAMDKAALQNEQNVQLNFEQPAAFR